MSSPFIRVPDPWPGTVHALPLVGALLNLGARTVGPAPQVANDAPRERMTFKAQVFATIYSNKVTVPLMMS